MSYAATPSSPQSPWQRLYQHLGDWRGSFTRLDPQGQVLTDTPSQVVLAALDGEDGVRQQVRFFPPEGTAPEPLQLEVRSFSRGLLFCETGAFSQGSLQYSPYGEFGAEFGFVRGDRRLRLVLQFRPSDAGSTLSSLTLIREHRADSSATPEPPLTADALLGTWEGHATSIEPTWYEAGAIATRLQLERTGDQITQTLTSPGFSKQSSGTLQPHGIQFERTQVLLLPGGGSCTIPTVIPRQQPFFLEVGWLLSPTERQRLMRTYDAQGTWTGLTLVQETKVA